MVLTYLKKRIKPGVPEVVIQEAVRPVKEKEVFYKSCSFQIWNYPYNTVLQNFKQSAMVSCAIGPVCLRHVTQVSKFSVKTSS
jgi:hypothetical protein